MPRPSRGSAVFAPLIGALRASADSTASTAAAAPRRPRRPPWRPTRRAAFLVGTTGRRRQVVDLGLVDEEEERVQALRARLALRALAVEVRVADAARVELGDPRRRLRAQLFEVAE